MSNRVSKEITLIDGVVLNSEADVEAEYSLSAYEADRIAQVLADADGRAFLLIENSASNGTPAFTLAGIEYSIDGSNFETWQSFGPVDMDGNGAPDGPELTQPFPRTATKLKLTMGGSAPDGSNYLTSTIKLRLERA